MDSFPLRVGLSKAIGTGLRRVAPDRRRSYGEASSGVEKAGL